MMRKTCRVCGRSLTLDKLVTDSHASLGVKSICKACYNAERKSGLLIAVDNGNLAMHIADTLLAGPTVNDNAWHHIAIVINRTYNTLSVYLDTELITVGQALALPVVSGDMFFGGAGMNGNIDEFALFEQALPKALIEQFAAHAPVGDEMGLMAKGSSDEDAILFMVTVTAQEQGDYLPHYEGDNPVEILQDLVAAITNDIEINIEYSETAYATAADLQTHEGKSVASNTGVHGFRYQGGRFQQIVGGVWSDLDITPGLAYLYDLCEKTTTIGDDGNGNTQITERNDTYEVTTVTTIVQTSPTVQTITQVITPDEGDSYTKTTVITETAGGKTIEESFVINE